jgi:MoaA/NifB/PqqE/SkfB family radical SAM enzyme
MDLKEIGFYTLSDDRAKNASETSPLWRGELILTDACNFRCPYCRGLPDVCKGNIPITKAVYIISEYARGGLKNIRFSGGEPLIYNGLVELVQFANNFGMKIGISSNGSMDTEKYLELISAGVSDFSISLDSCCSSTGEKMSGGVKGSWEKVINNIKVLSNYTYVSVGIVLTDDNCKEAIDTIKLADSLNVSDIRVIPAAQVSTKLSNDLSILLDDKRIGTKYPILRYRLKNVIDKISVRGLSNKDNISCPLVLDDMTVCGGFHYPCIIYLREHGMPIGKFSIIEQVRMERKNWFEKHNCRKDVICQGNCLDVCRDYNNKWNQFHGK